MDEQQSFLNGTLKELRGKGPNDWLVYGNVGEGFSSEVYVTGVDGLKVEIEEKTSYGSDGHEEVSHEMRIMKGEETVGGCRGDVPWSVFESLKLLAKEGQTRGTWNGRRIEGYPGGLF